MPKQVDLDQLFNRDFDNYKPETSSAFDVAMEKKVKQMQRIRYFKWFLFIVMVSGALTASILFMNKVSKADHLHTTQLIKPKTANEEIQPKATKKKDKKEQQFIQKPATDEVEEILIKETPQEKNIKNEVVTNRSIEVKGVLDESSETLVFERLISGQINSHIKYSRKELSLTKELTNNIPSIIIKEEIPKPKKKQKKKKKPSPEKSKQTKRKKKQKKEEVLITQSSLEIEKKVSNRDLRKQKRSNEKFQNKATVAMVPKARKERKPSSFSASIEFGFSPIFFKNMAVPYEPNKDTVTFFITNKKAKISYDYGVEFLFKQVDSDWSIKTGLHYQKLNEEIDYYFQKDRINEELSHWQYDSIFEYHIDPPVHDTILVRVDSSYYEHWTSDVSQKKHINQYSYLNIPLLIGYQIKIPDSRFYVNVLAGANLSILLQNQGFYYDEFGYILPYEKKQKAVFNWALTAQMSIYYQWKKMGIYAKPKLQFQMKEKHLDSNFEKRQYLIYGLEFGVNFKLF